MPKVNQEKLSDQIQEIIISQLLFAITNLESPKQTASFLSDFLTDAETIMLSKRLAIAVLLLRGHSQTLITKILSVSYSATGAVNSWLKNADPISLVTLNSISQAEEWKEIVYNYKVINSGKNKKRGRKPKGLSPEALSQIDRHVEVSPINDPSDMEKPDLSTIEGPELVLDESIPSNSNEPSMEELLDSE